MHRETAGDRIIQLGQNLFGTETIDDTILKLEEYFISIGCPVRLSETNYGDYDRDTILSTMISNKVNGNHHKMAEKDYEKLLDLMW